MNSSYTKCNLTRVTPFVDHKFIIDLMIKKIYIIMFLFLPLLVKDCILMYLETTILCIYNFLVLYKYLFGVFFFSFFIFWPPLA